MASIQKRQRNGKTSYRVQYRDPGGAMRGRVFVRKVDAERFRTENEHAKLHGAWTDPKAGKATLREYGAAWCVAQTFDETTREAVALRLRLHVYPHLGDHQLAALRPSVVQAWARGLQQQLAPSYVRVVFANLSAILQAAVDDGAIGRNPCRAGSVKPPAPDRRKVVPWPAERVAAVAAALPDRYRAVMAVAAGLGLRQGECFGLAVDDVDFLRGVVHVRRQVRIVGSRLVFAPPKTGKTRDAPLPESVALRLAAHLEAWPAVAISLPWREPAGRPETARLLFTTRERTALARTYFKRHVWKPALDQAGVPATRDNGMHAARHYYASALLEDGVNVRAVAEYLGHNDPGFTLRVYAHLMPSSEAKARAAVDRALTDTGSERRSTAHVAPL
jgi:integrase